MKVVFVVLVFRYYVNAFNKEVMWWWCVWDKGMGKWGFLVLFKCFRLERERFKVLVIEIWVVSDSNVSYYLI